MRDWSGTQTKEYLELLMDLQHRRAFLRRFTTWADVLAFMRSGTSKDASKDEVLRPILAAHAADGTIGGGPSCSCCSGRGCVRSIQEEAWDSDDPDELWQRIYWAFHQSVCRIDIARRRDHLVQRIYNSTIHRLHDDYRRDWLRVERETAADPAEITERAGVIDGLDFEWLDLRQAHQKEFARLQAALRRGAHY